MGDREPSGHFLVYDDSGTTRLDVRLEGETVWLTQAQLITMFDSSKSNISEHITTILAEGELPESTVREFRTVRQEGSRQVTRSITHYNLDMIISVGYRVRSKVATQFRIWATQRLREYIVKGFVLDDERLKEPGASPYFDELLERIREIRASEKLFYQKVRDLFAATSSDYDSTAEIARTFFATIQNTLLHAVTGQTAAELIMSRADAAARDMGLTSYRGSRVRKGDIVTAKNYLSQAEFSDLNLLVTMFLDYAENQARRRRVNIQARL